MIPVTDYFWLATFILASAVYVYFRSVCNYWKDRDIPCVDIRTHFRALKGIFCGKTCFFQIQQEIYNLLIGYRLGGYYQLTTPHLMIRDPELITRILTTDFSYFHDRISKVFHEGETLFLNIAHAQGERWHYLRCKLTPTFTTSKLRRMFEQISSCCDYLLKYINKHNLTQQEFDSMYVMNRFAMDVIATCAFGIEFPCNDEDRDNFLKMMKRIVSPNFGQMLRNIFIQYSPWISKLLKIKPFDLEASNYFTDLIRETIRCRGENHITRNDFLQLLLDLNKEEELNVLNFATSIASRNNITYKTKDSPFQGQQLLDQQKLFSSEFVTAQAMLFLTVGVEETTRVMSFFLFSVATHPDIQIKLKNEIDKIFVKYGEWNYQMLKEITYFDKVIQETMRMYPSSIGLARVCTKPYQLPDTNIILEPGTRIVIPTYALQHDPLYYPEPETFNPDRFQEANLRPNGCFLPFGDGPRMCLAMRFAFLEMKVCLTRLLSQYNIKLGSKTQMPIRFSPRHVSLQPKGGIWLLFENRNINNTSVKKI